MTFWLAISVTAHPARATAGFDWTAAAIGAASGFGLALILVGALLLAPLPTRRKPVP
jgi:hypothetical protein